MAGACAVGTALAFYDSFVFAGWVIPVFAPLIFSQPGSAAGAIATLAAFGISLIFRPLGAIGFGYVGDRLGRRVMLIGALATAGVASAATGLLPTAATLGTAAPVLLVVVRAVQGLSLGGVWAGAALMIAEHAPPRRRGLYGLFPQLGVGIALALSILTVLLPCELLGSGKFVAWGWRLPFLLSAVLAIGGLRLCWSIEETPVFRTMRGSGLARVPLFDAVRNDWRRILLAGGALMTTFAVFQVVSGPVGGLAAAVPGDLSRQMLLTSCVCVVALLCAAGAVAAVVSDFASRKKMVLAGTALSLGVGPAAFHLMESGTALAFFAGGALLSLPMALPFGCGAALLPDLFLPSYRATGVGMAYTLGALLGSGVPMALAPHLMRAYGRPGIGYLLGILGVISSLCVLAVIRDTAGEER